MIFQKWRKWSNRFSVIFEGFIFLNNCPFIRVSNTCWTICGSASPHTFAVTYSNNQLNAQFLYSITICMLHYNPRHVSSINMHIFRRTNCIITASGIVTLCKRLLCSLLSTGILYIQSVTIPDAVIIQFVLLKMGMVMLETCRGL
jgi:hypothetical protein